MDPEEVAEAFDQLQASGKVRFFGVFNFNTNEIELLQTAVTQPLMFDQIQFGLKHSKMIDSILHTNMEDSDAIDCDGQLLTYLRRKKITIISRILQLVVMSSLLVKNGMTYT